MEAAWRGWDQLRGSDRCGNSARRISRWRLLHRGLHLPRPLQYVELETLGPLATMNPGDRIEQTTVYTVTPRSTTDLTAEARDAFR